MFVIRLRNFFISLSFALVAISLALLLIKGLNLGIDFKGGAVLEVNYSENIEVDTVNAALKPLSFSASAQPFNDTGYIVRTEALSEEQRKSMVATLKSVAPSSGLEEVTDFEVIRFNSIGPSIGRELSQKAILALIVVMIAIILYVAYAFRNIADNVKVKKSGLTSWHFGFSAVIALLHDVLIPTGIFVLLALQVDSLFVVGLLSILGLSVNDTIVVFDRIRENITSTSAAVKSMSLEEIVGVSLKETIARSINTSMTLLVVLLVLYFAGPEATKNLALILAIGTLVGTYSSIFFASPLLLKLRGLSKKKEEK